MKAVTKSLAGIIFFIALAVLGLCVFHSPAWAGADLAVSRVDASGLSVNCQTLAATGTISVTTANLGDASTVAGFALVVFEDRDGNGQYLAGTDHLLGTISQAPLGPGATVDATLTVNTDLRFNGSLIYASVDTDNSVAEDDEANNTSNSGLSCQFRPQPGAFTPVLEWAWTSSTVLPSYLNVMMTPGIADLNGDHVADVVFGATNSTGGGYVEVGVLRALDGASGTELFTVTDPNLYINTASSVAVGDIDGDHRPEIVACDNSGIRLIVFEHDGAFKWRSPTLEAIYWGAPAIADLDHDGVPEIIVGRQVLNSNGTIRWSGTGGRANQGAGPISIVADLNMDGSPEVLAGNTAYTASGAILWRNASVPDGLNAVANFDVDAYPEIVLVANGQLYLLEHTGSLKWGPVAIPGGGAGGPPTVADYDNDGQVEIGVAGAVRYAVFETNSALKWAAVTQDGSSNRTGSSVFDFEGDGSAEVVYSDELTLRVYRGTDGAVLFQTLLSSCTWYEYPLVVDVDGDGNAEIVAVANNNCGFGPQRGIYVYGDAADNWVATRPIWNQHSYHITNVNDDATIPTSESDNWMSYNNYRQNVQTQGSIFAAPDLTASLVQVDSSNCPNGITLTARIGNAGANVAAAPVNVSFYNGNPGSGGTLLAVAQTISNLQPGQFEEVAINIPVPSGAMTICVRADDNGAGIGQINECNEQNNQCCADFDVFCLCVEDLAARPKSGKVQLIWTPMGAASYNVYRGTLSGGPYQWLANTVSTYATYLDSSVVNGTTYYYVIRPVNAGGDETCQSNEASTTPVAIRTR